ncbi:MAG: type II toxin-antitoxin system VapC family toxin [Nitrospirae bacterium]|nr:type II toxin-antitoxin system VapC family toxin [Nitrospirota bacterium]
MADSYIFDSHALLKFFQKEKGFDEVVDILSEIKKTGSPKYINVINLGEIIYITKREFGDLKKIEVIAHIERLNFTILDVPNSLIFQAAEYKAEYSISYADCFVIASAIEHKATIVTGDPEFKKVEHLVKIRWV